MKKSIKTMITVFSMLLLTVSSSAALNLTRVSASPQPATSVIEELSIVDYDAYYDECIGAVVLEATVGSGSENIPIVKVSVNGTNYTMTPIFYFDNAFQNNNLSLGVDFLYHLCLDVEGTYAVQFFAESGSESDSSSIVYFDLDLSVGDIFDGMFIDLDYERRYDLCNEYLIEIDGYTHNCEAISGILTIDGVNHTMNLDEVSVPYLYYDFGMDDDESHEIFATLISGNSHYETSNITINTSPQEKTFELDISEMNLVDSSTQQILIEFTNWENVGPSDIIIENNGVNTTLGVSSLSYWNLYISNMESLKNQGLPSGECEEFIVDWREGKFFGPFAVNLINNTNYNISFWVSNGTTWKEVVYMNDYLYLEYELSPVITTEILDQSITFDELSENWKLNLTVNVVFSSNAVKIYGNPTLSTQHPIFGESLFFGISLSATNSSDADFTDGKEYSVLYNLGQGEEDNSIWGDFQYSINIDWYQTFSEGDTPEFEWYSPVYTIDLPDAPEGQYGFNTGDWLIYDLDANSDSCCGVSTEIQSRTMYQIIGMGRSGGADYVDILEYIWIPCSEKWVCITYLMDFGYLLTLAFTGIDLLAAAEAIDVDLDLTSNDPFYSRAGRLWINPDLPRTYENSFFIPQGKLQSYTDYLNEKTAPDTFTLSGSTISYSITAGCFSQQISVTYNNEGVRTSLSETEQLSTSYINTLTNNLYVQGQGALPTDDGESEYQQQNTDDKIPGYFPSIFIFASILGVASLLFIIKKRR